MYILTHTDTHAVRFHFLAWFSSLLLFFTCPFFFAISFRLFHFFFCVFFSCTMSAILMTCIWPEPYGLHDFNFAKRYSFTTGWVHTEKQRTEKNTPFIHVLGRARRARSRRNMSFTSFIIFTSGIMTRSNFYFGNLYALQPFIWA